ncbi:Holliday junction resolvase RuvX [bacterium]|nr:Holliday junction resolvase RuvX [bacterium]
MALDWGTVRIGVALSDPMRMIASPYDTFAAKPRDLFLRRIAEIIDHETVTLVLVGLPLNMDGSEGSSAKGARELVRDVSALGVEVETWDERLSSFAAEKALREIGRKPSKDKARVDRVAATMLLQEYLDSHRLP